MKIGRDFALVSVTVVDGRGGEPQENQAVTVREGRIESVSPMSAYRHRDDLDEHDLDGLTVMPGLIDAHVHLAGGRTDLADAEHGTVLEPDLLRGMRSVHQAQQILRRGFTTVRDISWNGLYLKRLFADETMPGPKVIACGPGLTRTGGHADLHQFTIEYAHAHGPWGYIADGQDGVVKAVRHLLREGADAIKVFVSGGDNWPHDRNSDVHYSMNELVALVDEAHRVRGTVVAAHAENRESIRMAVEAGCDTIEHGEDLDEELALEMVRRGTILVPTIELIGNWYRDFAGDNMLQGKVRPDAFLYRDSYATPDQVTPERYTQRVTDSFNIARAAGVRIALGSDTVFEPVTPYGEYSAKELKALVQFGLTDAEAITAGTRTAADAGGMGHLIGTVERGKLADLLVVRGNPMDDVGVLYDVNNIHLTFCDGVLTVIDGFLAW